MRRLAVCPFALLILAVVPLSAAEPSASSADNFFFHPGDRVVFLGDSITMVCTL
jgi:hypothetical protein